MHFDLNALMRRLESVQALQNRLFCLNAKGTDRPLGGGYALFHGPGHMLNQALGQIDPIDPVELDAVEVLLGQGDHPVLLELSPALDPGSWALLTEHKFRIHQFQQLLVHTLTTIPAACGIEVHSVHDEERSLTAQVVAACYSERDDWLDVDIPFSVPTVPWSGLWLATVDGEPAGGGTLSVLEGVALLGGDGVLPRFRGKGVQKAIIVARLRAAVELGADIACASTLPSTPSQRAYEACGFRVKYPKVEMIKLAKA
jgi:GNAT superfamily N-acetyltransferase